jgi:hypothetical protein
MLFKFVDAPTGAGKTTALIKVLSETKGPFITCVPYNEELKRYGEELRFKNVEVCSTLEADTGNKGGLLLGYLKAGKSVITTHANFNTHCNEIAATLRESGLGYNLFFDEEPETFKACYTIPYKGTFKSTESRLQAILQIITPIEIDRLVNEGYLKANKQGVIEYVKDCPYGNGKALKSLFENNDTYLYRDNQKCFITFTKGTVWEAFTSVTVLSYRLPFSVLAAYCGLYNFPVKYYHIEAGSFVEGLKELYPAGVERIALENSERLIAGYEGTALSKSWYKKATGEDFKALYSCLRGFFRYTDKNKHMWTCFKGFEGKLKGKDVSEKACVACNLKATNDFIDKLNLAYTCNMYPNPMVYNFFKERGIAFNVDQWALSVLIQWLYRSNLRDTTGEDIVHIYILSARMRGLFQDWLESALRFGKSNTEIFPNLKS